MHLHPLVIVRVLVFLFFKTSVMPHFGHLPGLSCITSGCMTQVYLLADCGKDRYARRQPTARYIKFE